MKKVASFSYQHLFKNIFIYLLLERGEGRERRRGTLMYKRYRLPLEHPQPGTWPATQTCAIQACRSKIKSNKY